MHSLIHSLFDPAQPLHTFGYIGIVTTLFLESGIVIGYAKRRKNRRQRADG